MLYTCPKCNKPFDLDPKAVNETRSFSCPHCQAHFDFGAPAPQQEVQKEETPVKETAMEQPIAPTSAQVEEAPVTDKPFNLPDPFAEEKQIATESSSQAEAQTKVCPFCGEVIQAAAIKCRYCGEWLDDRNPNYVALKAPQPTASSISVHHHGDTPLPAPQHMKEPAPAPQPAEQTVQPAPEEEPVFYSQPMEEEDVMSEDLENKNKLSNGCTVAFIIYFIIAVIVAIVLAKSGVLRL